MRKLMLKKEALVELRLEDLKLVAGAATTPVGGCATAVASKVINCDATDSVLRPCITHTCTI